MNKPSLYLVPTPIGNLEDITLRAIRVLREVDLVLCEDTRTSGILLKHLEIKQKLVAHHQFNEHRQVDSLIEQLKSGVTAALVTDAGTPGISDPGFLLVREAIKAGIDVEVLPGPTAFIPALVASGIPCDTFLFAGFLPHKKGRQTRLKELALSPYTIVLYESPHRLSKLFTQLQAYFGPNRQAYVGRELTKLHESHYRGTIEELNASFQAMDSVKGELVVVVEGNKG
jgi:16S rRNA (cytidine1402-2'-O)-methyltransferase